MRKPNKPQRPDAKARKAGGAHLTAEQKANRAKRKAERAERAKRDGRKPAPTNIVKAAFYWGAVVGLWSIGGLMGLGAFVFFSLPDTGQINIVDRSPTVTLIDSKGNNLATRGDLYGVPVQVSELPPYVEQALLATEDRRFRYHFGFDPIGFTRAMLTNIRARAIVEGGSTITQQLAKNVFLTPEQTVMRKAQELVLALWLEYRYSKDEILTLYLNRVYFGAGTYGIDAASKKYFGHDATKLTLPESAMMVGLLKAPSRYAPTANLKRSRARAATVLDNMVEAGYLTEAEAARAKKNAASAQRWAADQAPRYYIDWVLDRLTEHVGHTKDDLIVTTTFDPALQALADRSLTHWLDQLGKNHKIGQGALISMTPDGAVRAMVGGRDYRTSQFNRATLAKRQPGSAFKPIVYARALEYGMTPRTVMRDSPLILGDWSPKNYDGKYHGEMTLKEALARSINTIAVKVSERAGRQQVIDMARKLGLTGKLPPHPSIALGTGEVTLAELTSAYAVFANGGWGVRHYGIVEIKTKSGQVLYSHAMIDREKVISTSIANTMTNMLEAVVTDGTGKRAAQKGYSVAGKTGTSQSERDAWFVGYSGDLVTGVWVGNDDATPMRNVTGGGTPALVWRDFMHGAAYGKPKPALNKQQRPVRDFFDDLFESIF